MDWEKVNAFVEIGGVVAGSIAALWIRSRAWKAGSPWQLVFIPIGAAVGGIAPAFISARSGLDWPYRVDIIAALTCAAIFALAAAFIVFVPWKMPPLPRPGTIIVSSFPARMGAGIATSITLVTTCLAATHFALLSQNDEVAALLLVLGALIGSALAGAIAWWIGAALGGLFAR